MSKRLHTLLNTYGMSLEFYLHPVFASQLKDFIPAANDKVKIMDFPYDYKKAFKEGSILVSDYSSVVFDFAYLNKPIIYAQFDRKEFYDTHTYPESDFFSDADQGFGPIVQSVGALVDELESTLQNNCNMEDLYRERVKEFFAFNDTKNSERVYEALIVE